MSVCGNSPWYLRLGKKDRGRNNWRAREENTEDRN